MRTPERNNNDQYATPTSKFEDSPVFSFLNNLSPIKPIKSTHIIQTINSLTFASVPSVFTSPHVKAPRESRFLSRHQLSDPPKPDFSSDGVSNIDAIRNVKVSATFELDDEKENLDPKPSDCAVIEEPFYECSKDLVELTQNSQYDVDGNKHVEASGQHLHRTEMNKEEEPFCAWESCVYDTVTYERSVDPATTFYKNIKSAIQKSQYQGTVMSDKQVLGKRSQMMGTAKGQDALPCSSNFDPFAAMESEQLSGLYRGMRRRCLVFETGGTHMAESSCFDSSMLLHSDGNISSNLRLVQTNKQDHSPHQLLPSIGLHLNALAASANGRLLIGQKSPPTSFHLPSHQDLLYNASVCNSFGRDISNVENSDLLLGDPYEQLGYVANEDINHSSSPEKKSRPLENAGESDGCKRCNCKKSKCLKLYCDCFAAGVYCVEPCACIGCFNTPAHEDTVLATRKQIESRNPLAFAPKVIRDSSSASSTGEDSSKTPASARHKRGCNCKRSGCLKKYCECYQSGVGCSGNCRCEGCRNAFGRKDSLEAETQEEGMDVPEKSIHGGTTQKTSIQADLDQNLDTRPLSSKFKPPRSSFPSICSSSSFSLPPPKFDQQLEDEIPDFLHEGSPLSVMKSSSPNGKRVSPPQGQGQGQGQGRRSSRKLMLQSIPSFPSLRS